MNQITLSYAYRNPDDATDCQIVHHTLNAEADLNELVQAFHYFVQAIGFTYVTHIGARKEGGDTVESAF
jgi:hypothetical protein